jgi:hypothetical protein
LPGIPISYSHLASRSISSTSALSCLDWILSARRISRSILAPMSDTPTTARPVASPTPPPALGIRTGLEDTPVLPDGRQARGNGDLVAATAALQLGAGLFGLCGRTFRGA